MTPESRETATGVFGTGRSAGNGRRETAMTEKTRGNAEPPVTADGETGESPYEDIIGLPHHVSATRPRMPARNRAAQFSPFSALTGYDAMIREAARPTDRRIDPGEDHRNALDGKQRILRDAAPEHPRVEIRYFVPDETKPGGKYVTVTGNLKRIDEPNRRIILTDGAEIPVDGILDIESDVFGDMSG